jgi:hypothetical protein
MAVFSIPDLRVSAVCAALPIQVVRNQDLDLLSKTQIEAERTVGIRTRRVARPRFARPILRRGFPLAAGPGGCAR